MPVLWKVYDFDYTSILSIERHQIERVRNSILHFHNHVNWKQDVASMNLALRLLDIIEQDGEAPLIGDNDIIFNDDHTITYNPDNYWELDRYVNTRNAHRFYPDWKADLYQDPTRGVVYKDHLRVEKAWQLYHKLRKYKLRRWWD